MKSNEFVKDKPLCPYCKREMYLEDINYRFKGNQNNDWECECGKCGATEEIRYGKRIKITFYNANGTEIISK